MRLGYLPALDGLRALAIGSVLLFHTTGYPKGGGLGVTLFFVLSGFLITTLLINEHRTHGAVSLRRFYVRRALRLLPALFVLLIAAAVVYAVKALIEGEVEATSFVWIPVALTYTMNFAAAMAPGGHVPMGHLWSLATEEQFYFVWPVLLVVVLGMRLGRSLVLAGLVLAAMTVHAARLEGDGQEFQRIWFSPDSGAAPIVVGCLLALALALGVPRPRASVIAVGSLLAFALMVMVDVEAFTKPGLLLLASLVCAGLVFGVLENSPASRLLATRPFVYVGKLSYSIYLWHALVLVVLGITIAEPEPKSLVAIVASVGIAAASYQWIEKPFLRRRPDLRRVAAGEDRGEALSMCAVDALGTGAERASLHTIPGEDRAAA